MISRSGSADALGVAALAVGWIVLATLVHPTADFPLNDDWIYAGSAKSIVEQGYFWIPGPAIPNLVAQAYWGALFCLPFGFSFDALRVSVLVLGLAGILGLYGLLRRLGTAPLLASSAAAVLAVNPLWFNLANCFMTDVPFLAVTLLAVLCLVIGEDKASRVATLAGLVLALVAILIRQTGIFLLVGYAAAYPVRHGFRITALAKGGLPLLTGLALHEAFQHWVIATGRAPDVVLSDVHALIPDSIEAFLVAAVRSSIVAIPYIGACMFPFVIITEWSSRDAIAPRRRPLARLGLAALMVFVMAWVVWKDDGMPVLKNLMYSAGIGPLTLRDVLRLHINQPVVGPVVSTLWLTANGIGVAGAVLLSDRLVRAGIAARSAGPRAAWLFTLTVVTAATYWFGILTLDYWADQYFDRYMVFLIPFAMIAMVATRGVDLARDLRWPRMILSLGCILVYAAFGVTGTHDYIEWNRARWRAADDLITARHLTPDQIDGGYEFNGWMYRDPRFPARKESRYWWGDPRQPYVIAYGPIDGYREIARYKVARWLPVTYPAILVLRKNDVVP